MPLINRKNQREYLRPSSLPMALEQLSFTDDIYNDGDSSFSFFDFPPPPSAQSRNAISLSGTTSQTNSDDENDQSSSWLRINDESALSLPPIGVFWDIENCQVPKGKSAVSVAQAIRKNFFDNYREAEFVVVCDVKKENNQILQELNDAQVNLIHVASTYKNACDEKLRQSIRRFADTHGSPSAIILISGDINFAADLSDLRHRKKIHVILLHKTNCSQALIMCASEHHDFLELVEDLPPRPSLKPSIPVDLLISCLPEDKDPSKVKNRLRQISDNCGGKVVSINKSLALVRFASEEIADRAQKRMHGEDVYGHRINVGYANRTPRRGFIRPNLSRYSGIPSSFIPHQLNFYQVQNSSPINCTDSNTPPPALMLPPPPSVFLNSSSISNEIKPQNEIKPRVIRGRSELRENSSDISENYITQFPPLSQLLSSTKSTLTIERGESSGNKHIKENIEESVNQRKKDEISFKPNQEILSAKSDIIKRSIYSLLMEVPNHSLPIHLFLRNLTKRFLINIENENLANYSDILLLSNDENNGTMVVLNPRYRQTLNELNDKINEPQKSDICLLHPNYNTSKKNIHKIGPLAKIKVRLKMFTQQIYKILHCHNGYVPLKSFVECYDAEFHKPIELSETGIPLEYVLNCVPNISIQKFNKTQNIKGIIWSNNQDNFTCDSLEIAEKLNSFCKEMFNILHDLPMGQIQLNKFTKYYQQINGYPCNPEIYGFSNTIELLDAIPTVVKTIGDGDNSIIILSFQAQIKRFINHMQYLLNNQDMDAISEYKLPEIYQKVFNKSWNLTEYGVCSMEDLLCKIDSNSLIIQKGFCAEIIISSPKISYEKPEIEKIHEFATHLVEILYYQPYSSMNYRDLSFYYEKFFSSKYRILDFSQFLNLIKEVNHILEIYEENGLLMIRLPYIYRLTIFSEQLFILLQTNVFGQISLQNLPDIYFQRFGFSLKLKAFLCVNTIEEALSLLSREIQLINNGSEFSRISIPFEQFQKKFILTLWDFLPQRRLISIIEFTLAFWKRWQHLCTLSDIEKNFKHLVNINKDQRKIEITEIQKLAWEIHEILLYEHSVLLLNDFCKIYFQRFDRICDPIQYGYPCIRSLLQAIPETIQINGKSKLLYINGNPSFEDLNLKNELNHFNRENSSYDQNSVKKILPINNHKLISGQVVIGSSKSCEIPQPPDPSQLPLPTKLQAKNSRMAANLFSEINK